MYARLESCLGCCCNGSAGVCGVVAVCQPAAASIAVDPMKDPMYCDIDEVAGILGFSVRHCRRKLKAAGVKTMEMRGGSRWGNGRGTKVHKWLCREVERLKGKP